MLCYFGRFIVRGRCFPGIRSVRIVFIRGRSHIRSHAGKRVPKMLKVVPVIYKMEFSGSHQELARVDTIVIYEIIAT